MPFALLCAYSGTFESYLGGRPGLTRESEIDWIDVLRGADAGFRGNLFANEQGWELAQVFFRFTYTGKIIKAFGLAMSVDLLYVLADALRAPEFRAAVVSYFIAQEARTARGPRMLA